MYMLHKNYTNIHLKEMHVFTKDDKSFIQWCELLDNLVIKTSNI